MVGHTTLSRKAFLAATYTLFFIVSVLCLLPMINILAISFSSRIPAEAGLVNLWPKGITISAYKFAAEKPEFISAMLISFKRTFLGVFVNMVLTTLMAYPLARQEGVLSFRKFYTWFLMIAMIFSGGLIPTYLVVKSTGLIDSIFALIIPGAVPIFNIIVLMNFFRGLPREIEEASFIDGANHFTALIKIYLPLSLPSLATLTLFSAVAHWNSWFDGILYMNRPEHYPLQSYLQTVIVQRDISLLTLSDIQQALNVSDRTNRAAQIFLGSVPILVVYPLLQKYFMSGLVLGSVKG